MFKRLWRLLENNFSFAASCPALLWQTYFLYGPLLVLFVLSFFKGVGYGLFYMRFSLSNYNAIFTYAYITVFLQSFVLATVTACTTLLIGFPVAHFLALRLKKYKTLFLVFLILPSWTSFIVQVYAWFFLLRKDGLVSNLLFFLGITRQPEDLIGTLFALFIGTVYCYLPFMIFPLFAVLERMDKRLLEASADLGANRFQTFMRVVLPLSVPGILAGCLLVFVPVFGEFAIPELLGGAKHAFLGSVIVDKFITFNEWGQGSALAMISMFLPMICFLALYLFMRSMLRARRQIASRRLNALEAHNG